MVNRVVVLGGGSAGFIAALTLKIKLPELEVLVLRSKDIGVIGVGEGTTTSVPKHFHVYLKVNTHEFYRLAQPIWKLGIHFIWGPRPSFNYVFGFQYFSRYAVLPKHTGYYCDESVTDATLTSALMDRDLCFPRRRDGSPELGRDFGYHFENEKLVGYLESESARRGVLVRDATVTEVLAGEQGVTGLRLESGEVVTGDLYLDASGFRSVLLGQTLKEPYVSFKTSLFCDRAVVGGWDRAADEPIKPFTTAETMNHGWCWRIDHEHRVNRGYVYCSAFTSDEEADGEFRQKNPKVAGARIVRFVAGRYERVWVKNVIAFGNAGGFVEPLEASSLGSICVAAQNLAEMLIDCDRQPRPAVVSLFNRRTARDWDDIRKFLAVHYKFNTRLDTPFWRAVRETTDLAGAEPVVEYFQDVGPTPIWDTSLLLPTDAFGAEGYLSMLVGQRVPYRRTHQPSAAELENWAKIRRHVATQAAVGVGAAEVLAHVRAPTWVWSATFFH